MADPNSAKGLAEHLNKFGISGYATCDIKKFLEKNSVRNSSERLEKAFREIILARALYRCGDYQGIGMKILNAYHNDLQGVFAGHADAVLKSL